MSKKILVIDDELDIRDVVCLSLEEFGGWETGSAGSGQAGVSQAYAWDAILLDVSMPDMDGFAVFEQLQAMPSTQGMPVILLTAKVLGSDYQDFEQMGIAGIIAKPFDPVLVWQKVAAILGWTATR